MNSKRNTALIITSIIFGILAVGMFLIGGMIAGWDFKAWFSSQQAYAIYILAGIYVLSILAIISVDTIKKM